MRWPNYMVIYRIMIKKGGTKMAIITVKSQKELDMIPLDTEDIIRIEFGTCWSPAIVRNRYKYRVVARENSSVEARGNSSVVAWENSSVVAWGNSSVEALFVFVINYHAPSPCMP